MTNSYYTHFFYLFTLWARCQYWELQDKHLEPQPTRQKKCSTAYPMGHLIFSFFSFFFLAFRVDPVKCCISMITPAVTWIRDIGIFLVQARIQISRGPGKSSVLRNNQLTLTMIPDTASDKKKKTTLFYAFKKQMVRSNKKLQYQREICSYRYILQSSDD